MNNQKDYILYIDIVKSTSFEESKLTSINNDVFTYLDKIFKEKKIGKQEDELYINFTGDGYVCVINSNCLDTETFIKICKDLYVTLAVEENVQIRLAASYDENHWVSLGINQGKKTPCGKGIISCSRLLSAAGENNIVFSKTLINDINILIKIFPGFYFDPTTIETKDVENDKRKTLQAYNVYSICEEGEFGSPFYNSTYSSYISLSELVCSKFHNEYREQLKIIFNTDKLNYKISALIRHKLGDRSLFMALPGRLFMNGKPTPKSISSKMLFEYNPKEHKYIGCPAIAAKTKKVSVLRNLENISKDDIRIEQYIENLTPVRLYFEDVKKMKLHQNGCLPSCFISIPYIPEKEKNNKKYIPELIVSIDTDKQIAKDEKELIVIAEKIQKIFNSFAMEFTLLALTSS